jgi:hypothetical protein
MMLMMTMTELLSRKVSRLPGLSILEGLCSTMLRRGFDCWILYDIPTYPIGYNLCRCW